MGEVVGVGVVVGGVVLVFGGLEIEDEIDVMVDEEWEEEEDDDEDEVEEEEDEEEEDSGDEM